MNNNSMPIVEQTAPIGIQRHFKDSSTATIGENLKIKSTPSLYSLMRSGLHGENGLDPITSISILRTYVIPIMFYGLETLLPSGKSFEILEKQYKKMIKQVLSLPINIADPAIYIISGLIPAEAEIHKRAIILYGCIFRSGKTSTEWKIAERQLSIKSSKSKSWFIDITRQFMKYGIGDPYDFLDTVLIKYHWKSLIKSKIHSYWISTISEVCNLYSSLKYLKGSYKIGQCHPLATTISANMREIIRTPIRLKIATGTYILQANRASFNRSQLNPICLLCGNGEETLDHFLLTCDRLDCIRAPLVKDIINTCSALFAKNKADGNINLIQVLVNPYFYSNNREFTNIISEYLELLCRFICYRLHTKRYELLGLMSNKTRKGGSAKT
jgi:hypothetical protein